MILKKRKYLFNLDFICIYRYTNTIAKIDWSDNSLSFLKNCHCDNDNVKEAKNNATFLDIVFDQLEQLL